MSISIKLSHETSEVELLEAGLPIGISSSSLTERGKGLSKCALYASRRSLNEGRTF